jgi:hypothetical protein
MAHLTIEEATKFYSEFYRGEHHIPGEKPKQWGLGFTVIHDRGELSSFDFNSLTKLVLMAHDQCIRVEVSPHSKKEMRISIWKRERDGSIDSRHPTIEQAISTFRGI